MENRASQIVRSLSQGPPPSLDAVADALLQMAVRDQAIDQAEATELLNWDLATIAEFLALRLQECGFLSDDDVDQILVTHTSYQLH
ncbi:MAG: hypothetical protein P8Y44_01080 [Acidobacteriota bacterium]|jgi:hypothetical protein